MRLFFSLLLLVTYCTSVIAYDVVIDSIGYDIVSTIDRSVKACEYFGQSESVSIPETIRIGTTDFTVTVMGEGQDYTPFSRKIKEIQLPNTLKIINRSAFRSSNIETVIIPDSVTYIYDYAFYECWKLKDITMPNNNKLHVSPAAFASCQIERVHVKNIESWCNAIFESSPLSNGSLMYLNNTQITDLVIPNSVKEIKSGTFAYCDFESITFGEQVEYIGRVNFLECKGLKSIYFIGTTPPQLDVLNFHNLTYATTMVYVPNGCKEKYATDDYWKYFINIQEIGSADLPKCGTPNIAYNDGELKFTCNIPNASYHYTINDPDISTTEVINDGTLKLSAMYQINVYSSAVGYTNSDTCTAYIYWINGELQSTGINSKIQHRGIIVKEDNSGMISVEGLMDFEHIEYYTLDGKYIGRSSVNEGISIFVPDVHDKIIIAKIGNDSIKISRK